VGGWAGPGPLDFLFEIPLGPQPGAGGGGIQGWGDQNACSVGGAPKGAYGTSGGASWGAGEVTKKDVAGLVGDARAGRGSFAQSGSPSDTGKAGETHFIGGTTPTFGQVGQGENFSACFSQRLIFFGQKKMARGLVLVIPALGARVGGLAGLKQSCWKSLRGGAQKSGRGANRAPGARGTRGGHGAGAESVGFGPVSEKVPAGEGNKQCCQGL